MSTFEQVIRSKGRTFALASRLLPPKAREATVVLYAWFRRADDDVDESPAALQVGAAMRVRAEVGELYSGAACVDPLTDAARIVIEQYAIPRVWFDEFANGMVMDAEVRRYATAEELFLYCYRVAGTVGAAMTHVLGAPSAEAVRSAVDLGIAMQLTNICRDVAEDAANGRLYLPANLLPAELEQNNDPATLTRPEARAPVAMAIAALLEHADQFYRSGELGMTYLAPRTAFAIRAAQRMYREIGIYVRQSLPQGWIRRALVPRWRKWQLVLEAALDTWFRGPKPALPADWPPPKVSP